MRIDHVLRKTNIKGDIARLLHEYPELRDSDALLWLAYFNQKYGLRSALGPVAYSAFKGLLLSNAVPSFESITRARRKVQEQHPELANEKSRRVRAEIQQNVKDWSVGK